MMLDITWIRPTTDYWFWTGCPVAFEVGDEKYRGKFTDDAIKAFANGMECLTVEVTSVTPGGHSSPCLKVGDKVLACPEKHKKSATCICMMATLKMVRVKVPKIVTLSEVAVGQYFQLQGQTFMKNSDLTSHTRDTYSMVRMDECFKVWKIKPVDVFNPLDGQDTKVVLMKIKHY